MKQKFRAYWEHTHQTSEVTEINYKGNWVCDEPYVVVDGRCDLIPLRECTIMQSTGLKDKNGVEIYEGDIVRHSKISTDISIVQFGEFGVPNIEEMEYQDMAVGFYFENASDLKDVEPFNMTIPLNNLYVKGIEIIGNIYENPELLEVE